MLLGPSGCGKSTLLNCIAGLLDVSDGQIFIKGKNVTWEEPKDRGIGMVFQSYALYPQMTVEGNLSFGLKTARMPKDEIDTARGARRRNPADRAAAEAQAVRSSPAASASASPSAGRWCATSTSSCSTSRCPTSTPSCAPSCASRSSGCTSGCQHHDLRHPRPDRGDDAGRPHRGHEGRRSSSSSTRRRRSTTGRSTASSPASSARRG